MALNVNALRRADESLNRGNNMFMKSSEIGEDTIVRLLPPSPELNGLFYFEQIVYWVNKTPLVSPSTFGERCVIEEYLQQVQEELDLAKSKGKPDKDLQKLYDKASKKRSNFMIPLLHLDCKYDDDGELKSYTVVKGGPRILQCGPQLLNAINKVVLSPKLLRRLSKVDNGITDRVEGYNISLSRTGTGLDTQYGATEDDPLEIEAKYYENIPSLVSLTKKQTYTDDYLKAVLDNYFYGDDEPDSSLKVSRFVGEDSEDEGEVEEAPKKRSRKPEPEDEVEDTPKRTNRRKKVEEVEEEGTDSEGEEGEVEEKPARKSTRKKSITDDLEDLDD